MSERGRSVCSLERGAVHILLVMAIYLPVSASSLQPCVGEHSSYVGIRSIQPLETATFYRSNSSQQMRIRDHRRTAQSQRDNMFLSTITTYHGDSCYAHVYLLRKTVLLLCGRSRLRPCIHCAAQRPGAVAERQNRTSGEYST